MGGAIGGVLFTGGTILSTAASLLGKDAAEEDYYQSMAATAEAQAQQTQANARTDVLFGHGADDFKKQPLKCADGSGNVK